MRQIKVFIRETSGNLHIGNTGKKNGSLYLGKKSSFARLRFHQILASSSSVNGEGLPSVDLLTFAWRLGGWWGTFSCPGLQ